MLLQFLFHGKFDFTTMCYGGKVTQNLWNNREKRLKCHWNDYH